MLKVKYFKFRVAGYDIDRSFVHCVLGCPILHFFLIELHPFNHSGSWIVGVHKKKFQRYRPKIDVRGKIFVFDPIYKGQNKPENQQNWNLAKIGPKSDKFTKSKP